MRDSQLGCALLQSDLWISNTTLLSESRVNAFFVGRVYVMELQHWLSSVRKPLNSITSLHWRGLSHTLLLVLNHQSWELVLSQQSRPHLIKPARVFNTWNLLRYTQTCWIVSCFVFLIL